MGGGELGGQADEGRGAVENRLPACRMQAGQWLRRKWGTSGF